MQILMVSCLCILLYNQNLGASVRLLASKFPAALYIAEPINGLLPIEQAILNAGKDGSLENIDAVDALLRANPAFLE
jgi:ABC-type transport system involved in cytochrome c biogenesis permease component